MHPANLSLARHPSSTGPNYSQPRAPWRLPLSVIVSASAPLSIPPAFVQRFLRLQRALSSPQRPVAAIIPGSQVYQQVYLRFCTLHLVICQRPADHGTLSTHFCALNSDVSEACPHSEASECGDLQGEALYSVLARITVRQLHLQVTKENSWVAGRDKLFLDIFLDVVLGTWASGGFLFLLRDIILLILCSKQTLGTS